MPAAFWDSRRAPPGRSKTSSGIAGTDDRRVEDVEVGDEAFAQQAAVGESDMPRGLEGEHAHRLLEREVLPVAHQVSEQVRLDRRVGHLADVRARVGEAHHRVGWRRQRSVRS